MAIYLKEFDNHTQYENYINGSGAILPNVSLCTTEGDVYYNPSTPVPPTPVETRLVAKYNVTSTSEPTILFYSEGGSGSGSGSGGEVPFSDMEIDGIEMSVGSSYTFEYTGEHTVKFTLADPTSIGEKVFYQCSSLTSVDIPNTVTSIGDWTFYDCNGLTSIVIPNSVTSIGEKVFQYCSGLTSIDIPDSVTTIGDGAFYGCSGLTSCTIGSGVTSIGNDAFYQCSSLISVVIPNSVTTIGNYAFQACSGLTSIVIPSGVTSIGEAAFYQCSSLISIVCNATTAPTIESETFYYVKTGGTLTVQSGSSGYDVWMGTGNFYLGKYNWTKVER